jgi:zinc/manganese transport system substrate-binding protein
VLPAVALLYRPLAVDAFDPVFLRVARVRAPYAAIFLVLVVLALVANFQAFGTLLAVGPILLPAATARCWGLGAAASMALAAAAGFAASIAGLLASYHANLPSGPARAVFLNDLNEEFEPWLEPLLKQARFHGEKVVVSRHVRTLLAEEEHPVSGRQLPAAIDQHAWLDPRNGVIYIRNIAAALAHIDPPDAAEYQARAAAYIQQVRAIDDWARKELGVVPAAKRRVLTSHDSLEYIANTYGIVLLTVNGWTNNSEPSAAELAKLARRIQAEHVKALFLDSITDPRAMRRIASETGAVIGGTLYGDALSPAGGEADTYLKMLRHDVSTFKAGMLLN